MNSLLQFPPKPEALPEINAVLFCGGGGADVGIEEAGHQVHLAINHDPEAIQMHKANFPGCQHFTQNVWQVSPRDATRGRRVKILWASPDCKHFSRAKGAALLDRNIRDLAWVVVKWAEEVHPEYVFMENVPEFLSWCDLIQAKDAKGRLKFDSKGNPIWVPNKELIDKNGLGNIFKKWQRKLRKAGYRFEYRVYRVCDMGVPTTRERLFMIARKGGLPIVWPKPTHGPAESLEVQKGKLKPYKPAADCIDWNHPTKSIFGRKKNLAENTLRRIAAGIQRFVKVNPYLVATTAANQTVHGSAPHIITNTSGHGPNSIQAPAPTVTTGNHHYLSTPFMVKSNHTAPYYHCFRGQSLQDPLQTVTQAPGFSLCAPNLQAMTVIKNFTGVVGQDARKPLGTVTSVDHNSIAAASLTRDFGMSVGQSLHIPAPTVMASGQGKIRLTAASITKMRRGCVGHSVEDPIHTVAAESEHHALTAAHISKMRGSNIGSRVNDPLQTVSAGGNHHGLALAHALKFYGTNIGFPVDSPMHAVTTKHRHGLVESLTQGYRAEDVKKLLCWARRPKEWGMGVRDEWDLLLTDAFEGQVVLEGDVYVISDIGFRMLQPRELARAQGFKEDFVLDPNFKGKPLSKRAQVKMIGNSVPPDMAKLLIQANVPAEENETTVAA